MASKRRIASDWWLLPVALILLGSHTPPASAALLRLDGVGPLGLGMTRATAFETGWLSNRRPGCELGGPPLPIVYRLRGPRAPASVAGSVEFRGGRLRNIVLQRGARTAVGVKAGRTTAAGMVARYQRAGYGASAKFIPTFQATFVTVTSGLRTVMVGYARRSVVTALGVPTIPLCE